MNSTQMQDARILTTEKIPGETNSCHKTPDKAQPQTKKAKPTAMPNDIVIARTILESYRNMEIYKDLNTRLINKSANLSFYSPSDTEKIMNGLINKIQRKQTIHNLQVKVSKFIKSLRQPLGITLEMYFMDGDSIERIAQVAGVLPRAIYSRIQSGISELAICLDKIGITPIVWDTLLKTYRWLRFEFEAQTYSPTKE